MPLLRTVINQPKPGWAVLNVRLAIVLVVPMADPRRFPPPWKIEVYVDAYVVTDSRGQELAYLCFKQEPQGQAATKRLSKDDAWRIARAITRIPPLMHRD